MALQSGCSDTAVVTATPTSTINTLVIDAPVGRHFTQIHRDESALSDSVFQYVRAGILRNGGVVIVATPERRESIGARLAEAGVDVEIARRRGQLAEYDAEETLDTFMRAGMPDWVEFQRVISAALEQAIRLGGATRAYGEMVNLLWQSGQPEAAIRLEEFWNEIGKTYPFCMFCGYTMDPHRQACYNAPLHAIGRTHTDVIETQDDERFRAALDAACQDVFGVALSQMLTTAGREEAPGEARLPSGQRTMLWIMRHMPASSADVLERTNRYIAEAG